MAFTANRSKWSKREVIMITANEASAIAKIVQDDINEFDAFLKKKGNKKLLFHLGEIISEMANKGYNVISIGKKELFYPKDHSKLSKKEFKDKIRKENAQLILYLESRGYKCSWDGDCRLFIEW